MARVRLMLFARRRVPDFTGDVVDVTNGVRGGVRLVGVIGLAVHQAEVRLEHQRSADARVFRLVGIDGVGLNDRGDVGYDLGRAVTGVAAVRVVSDIA